MNKPVTLSASDRTEAQRELFNLLHEESGTKTLLLVLGNDSISDMTQKFCCDALEAAPRDFVSVVFVFIPEPSFIKAALQDLPISITDPAHHLDWNDFENYGVLSVSPAGNCISDCVSRSELEVSPGAVRSAIWSALSNY